MNEVAYLVMVLDVSVSPPMFKGMGIFSEPAPTLNSLVKLRPIVIHEEKAASYHVAHDKLVQAIRTDPWLQWALPYLRPSPIDGQLR